MAVWPRRLGGAKTTKLRPLDGAKMEAPPTECRQWIPLAGVRPTQKLRPLGVVGGVQWMCVATPTGWSQNPKLHPLGAVKPPQTPPTRSQLGVFQLAGIDHAHLGGAWLKLRPLLCSQPWGCVVCRPRPPHAIGGGALTGRGHGEAPPTKRVQWGGGVMVGLWGSLGGGVTPGVALWVWSYEAPPLCGRGLVKAPPPWGGYGAVSMAARPPRPPF